MQLLTKEELREQLVTQRELLKQSRHETNELYMLLEVAWEAIQEAGYEDFNTELNDYFKTKH